MFKVIAYLDEWEDLYVSDHASPSMRAYRGKEGIRDGSDGEVIITELGYSKQDGERPRLVQLFTLAKQPWASLLIGDFLHAHAGEAIKEILKGGGRATLAGQISTVFKVCEQIDARLRYEETPPAGKHDARQNSPETSPLRYFWQAISFTGVLVSVALLAWTFLEQQELKMGRDKYGAALAAYEGLHRTNVLLVATNRSLTDTNSILEDRKDQLTLEIGKLDTTRRQLDSTNAHLVSESKAQLERMRKGQWVEIVEAQIISTLKAAESGLERDEVVKSVKAILPAVTDEFIKECLKGLVSKPKSPVVNQGRTEAYGSYMLKGTVDK